MAEGESKSVVEVHTTGGRTFQVVDNKTLREVKRAIGDGEVLFILGDRDRTTPVAAFFNPETVAAITSYPA